MLTLGSLHGHSTVVVPVTGQESEALSPVWGSVSLRSLRDMQEEMLSVVLGI